VSYSQFLRSLIAQITQRQITETQKMQSIRYFIFISNFDLAKGGASAPLAPSSWLRSWLQAQRRLFNISATVYVGIWKIQSFISSETLYWNTCWRL